jgi:hypothetical protein
VLHDVIGDRVQQMSPEVAQPILAKREEFARWVVGQMDLTELLKDPEKVRQFLEKLLVALKKEKH